MKQTTTSPTCLVVLSAGPSSGEEYLDTWGNVPVDGVRWNWMSARYRGDTG